ncbi:MAG: NADH-quinone oxidoreductase subunit B family protein [Gammaproteobacteria bacterium]
MSFWPYFGLKRGIKTTSWPSAKEQSPGITPGRPRSASNASSNATTQLCPTGALHPVETGVSVDLTHCIHCQRCRQGPHALPWEDDVAWTVNAGTALSPLGYRFRRSLHVRYIDAGACGACINEARLLDAPVYNLHRLGIFITASPRDADVLLVAGPITNAMCTAVRKAYSAMPHPKRVVGMGVCAINGGIFGENFACVGGLQKIVPVDLWIPGCPPPPLAILHGLLAVVGRTQCTTAEELP